MVTNPTSSRQKLTVLLQLPVGAIPVANGQFTRSVPLDLEPYRTQTIDYLFYFPLAGKFAALPGPRRQERAVRRGRRSRSTFDVVDEADASSTPTSWDYVSQHGTDDEVLAFLNRENVRALNLDKIAFRMKDRGVLRAAITRCSQERHVYHPTLWSYGLFHADVPTAAAVPDARTTSSSPSAAGRSTARC